MDMAVQKTIGGRHDMVMDHFQATFVKPAEAEMPGLVTCCAEFGPSKPLKGARITVSSHMTTKTTSLTEILTAFGAEVRCSSNSISAAAAGDQECWRNIRGALDWGLGIGPDLIIDDGDEATLLIHEGVKAEEIYAKTGQLPDPSFTDNSMLKTILSIVMDGLETNPMRYHNMKQGLVGVSVESATSVERLLQMQTISILSFTAINIIDSITKTKYRNLFSWPYALLEGITRATNMSISGKIAVVCGYGDEASEGCAIALKQAGANVVVYEVDPKHGLRACLRGFSVIKTLDNVVSEADIFVMNKNNIDVFKHVKKMKNNTIIYNMNPISDHNSSTYDGFEQYFSGMKCIVIDPQTDKWVFPSTNSSIVVLRNKGYPPSFTSSWSSTCHVVAMLELWSMRCTGKYEYKVYDFPEHLEEKVSALHLAKFTKTTNKETKGKADDHVFVTTRSGKKKRTLLVAIQACSVICMVAFGFMKASKVGTDLAFPKVTPNLPLSAFWGD